MASEERIDRAMQGDVAAFTDLVGRYQGMAFGYALALLRDFHLAQDATQEAFVAAYFGLGTLDDPGKFPSWLRGIVRHQCARFLRRRQVATVALDTARTAATPELPPDRQVEERDGVAAILAAIDALPEALRAVTILFYLEERSQREIAAFLALPVTTVNNRLHAARKRLKEGRLAMTRDAFAQHGLPADFAARVGQIVRARGPLIEARFAPDAPPPVFSALIIADPARGVDRTASVIQHLPDGLTRAIILAAPGSPAADLAAGTTITDTAQPVERPTDAETVRAAIALLGMTTGTAELLETGIKVIDLLCPFPQRGTIGLFGDMGVGKAVLIGELQQNLSAPDLRLAIVTFIQSGDEVTFFQPYSTPSTDTLQALYIAADQPAALASPDLTAALDAIVYLTRDLAVLGLFPAVDHLASTSRLLTPAIVGAEHYRVAQEVRALLQQYPESASSEGDQLATRARRLRRFLSQAMFIAEPYTHVPGEFVRREDTVRGCAAILRGDYDHLPEAAFVRIGRVEQAVEKGSAGG
jgi:RNA polymerase sigma factor (sigma-70 family)